MSQALLQTEPLKAIDMKPGEEIFFDVQETRSAKNTSGIEPLGQAVLVELHQPERKTGQIALPEGVRQKEAMVEVRARIVAIGPDAWHDEPRPRAQVGDLVVVSKFAGFYVGKEMTADGKEYRAVNGRDIFLKIKE